MISTCPIVVGRAVIPKTCLTLKISAMAFTKALLNALPQSVSNIVLHTPCLVKTCVYNAEATASIRTLLDVDREAYFRYVPLISNRRRSLFGGSML